MNIEKLKELIPEDFKKHCSRDLGIFTSSIFGETYVKSNKEMFGIGFSIVLWLVKDKNFVTFYRSEKEQQKYRSFVGKKCKDKEFVLHLVEELRKWTDWINRFIEENNSLELFLGRKKEFIDNYRTFFAYHQIIYWASHFLHENNPESEEILKELDSSYKYNEMVVPNVEAYLKKLSISHLHYNEIEGEIKNRGLFFFDNGEQISIFGENLNEIEEFIKSKETIDKKVKDFKGIGIHNGTVRGKVKIVKENELIDTSEGIVLVTGMTRPQLNYLFKKCKAIVTEEGGMLCHAAILAREEGIPCVVGTKNATKILKDGDIVEVDANNGVVKKLS